MPQLDTLYIFTIYIWTWTVLYTIMQKTKTLLLVKPPKNPIRTKTPPQPPTMPWT